jgi:hypothetical protein
MQALDQICRCPKVNIDKYIDNLMPMLLGSTQHYLGLTVDELEDVGKKDLVETMVVHACNIFSCFAVRSSISYPPHIGKVGLINLMFVAYAEVSTLKICN